MGIRSIRGGHIRNRKRMGIRSKHQHRLQHQQISFRSRHNRGGHMGIRSIHRGHQHQPLAQHQRISCHSSNRGGHMGIHSIHGGHNHGGHMGIHSIHGGHSQGDVHSHSSHREH